MTLCKMINMPSKRIWHLKATNEIIINDQMTLVLIYSYIIPYDKCEILLHTLNRIRKKVMTTRPARNMANKFVWTQQQ